MIFPTIEEITLPPPEDCSLPITQLMPFDKSQGYWHRIMSWLFSRPKFIVTESYFTYIYSLRSYAYIPKNLVYDFASTPKLLGFLFRPTGIFAYPSSVHDFGYRFGCIILVKVTPAGLEYSVWGTNREEIDGIFKELANKANGLPIVDAAGTFTLRLTGWANYHPRQLTQEDWTKPVY